VRLLRCRSVVPLVAILLVLSACGRAKTFDRVVVRPKEPAQVEPASPTVAADRALAFKFARDREIVVLTMMYAAVRTTVPFPPRVERSSPTVSPPTTMTVGAAASFDWDCVATAETGGDYTAHGPSYSSAYGVMNEAVRENAPVDVAARILRGSASPSEQLAMAQSIAAKHGIRAWAPGTVAMCAHE
jgi:hypothetical protein